MPERIRLRRTKGWRMPAGAVKVDRTTVYGNPFRVGGPNILGWGQVRDAAHAVWLHRQWLVTPSRSIAVELERHDTVLAALAAGTLTGKDLACWCALDAHHCHADTLLTLANRPDIADVAAALLDPNGLPWGPIEVEIALGQLGRLMKLSPEEVVNFGRNVIKLADQVRAARTEPEGGEG